MSDIFPDERRDDKTIQISKRLTHLDVGEVDGSKLGPSLCIRVGLMVGVPVGIPVGLELRSKEKAAVYTTW